MQVAPPLFMVLFSFVVTWVVFTGDFPSFPVFGLMVALTIGGVLVASTVERRRTR